MTLSAILVARFLAELRAATDRMGPDARGHFTLLAMGATDRIQVLGQGEWWRGFHRHHPARLARPPDRQSHHLPDRRDSCWSR